MTRQRNMRLEVIDRFTGWEGVAAGLGIFVLSWIIVSLTVPKHYVPMFDSFDGSFEKLLTIYIDVSKFILGLASAGIVLVVGSFELKTGCQTNARLFAPPLYLLAMSILYGVLFMPLLVLNYEAFRHHAKPHTRLKYIRNRVLAYSGLSSFCLGYAWLIKVAVS
jgi:hypothetical protein